MTVNFLQQPKEGTDRKLRWGGILENPLVSAIQRNCLDYGRVSGLEKALKACEYKSVLDVGCGLGECSMLSKGFYCGLDNSLRRVDFAVRKYKQSHFFVADALRLPVEESSFDLVMLIDTSHHLSDQGFYQVLLELKRVSKKYIVVSDPVVTPDQSRLSAFFYRLDRGACFREPEEMKKNFARVQGLRLKEAVSFKTFPGLYVHAAFILEKGY